MTLNLNVLDAHFCSYSPLIYSPAVNTNILTGTYSNAISVSNKPTFHGCDDKNHAFANCNSYWTCNESCISHACDLLDSMG